MIITTSPVVVTRAVTSTRIEVICITDYSVEKRVVASIAFYTNDDVSIDQKEIQLWRGDAYDAVGQWTDQDVVDRVEELLAV